VEQLVGDAVLRSQLGANARRYAVQHLGRQQVLERFEEDVKSLMHASAKLIQVQEESTKSQGE
jgi:colanic acid biosynthesis glycosyl transferase WcaI